MPLYNNDWKFSIGSCREKCRELPEFTMEALNNQKRLEVCGMPAYTHFDWKFPELQLVTPVGDTSGPIESFRMPPLTHSKCIGSW